LKANYRKTVEQASQQELYQAVAASVKDVVMDEWIATQNAVDKQDPKTVYYMSMEFLMGRALGNILINLCSYKEVKEALYQELIRTKKDATKADKDELNENIEIFLKNPQQMRNTDKLFQYMWNIYKKIGYDISRPTSGRDYRTNKIIDMTWEVLTHSDTVDKILNPGGFEEQKYVGYLVQAARITGKSIKELEKLSTP
jgi:hypothetical protein